MIAAVRGHGLLILGLAVPGFAADPVGLAFFEQRIRPALIEHCYECHSADAKKLRANLLLDTKAGWQKGGDSGEPAIIPGQPERSLLIRSIQHLEDDLLMPPKKPKLPAAVIADFVTWVRNGAPDHREGGAIAAKRADKSWWSLQPLAAFDATRSIDDFVRAQLAEKNLTLNPPADARTLIRRMSYDVTGLPPSAGEVETFAAAMARDPDGAVVALADRLLASPRYGERWGRHWLDVVRFGESVGFERNVIIDDLWPFRDYVIRSLNADKPMDQFITEHLAGDVIGKGDPAIEVASAFLVAGPYDDVKNQDVAAMAHIRAATLDDMITATGGAFLGLTFNCARCHHHKFDPIPTEDYYRLRAAFEGVTHGRRVVASDEERAAFAAATAEPEATKARLTQQIEALNRVIQQRAKDELARHPATRPKIDPELTEERFEPVAARHVKFKVLAHTGGPRGVRPGASRLVEFQVWSAGANPRNVALAANGAQAAGARSAVAEDFPEAYGPQVVIDGEFGEQWFIGIPPELTITLAQTETIDRIAFSNAKGRNISEGTARGETPCEYEVLVSADGQAWQTVASSAGREPWTLAHGIERVRPEVTTPAEAQQLAGLRRELAQANARLNAVPKLRQVWAGNFTEQLEPTFVHQGGDPMKPAAPVPPSNPSVLDRVAGRYELSADASDAARRLALARWITGAGNPLTPRVLANRVWHYHFGTGIVDTPSDFGFLGGRPTHPELLDQLAQRLVRHGWRLKPLHREILLSQAYRQSSAHRADAAQVDKEARFLWRFPPRRLSAEEVRDTMLNVAGKLRLEPMGGPGFRLYKFTQNNVSTYFPLDEHGPATYRRAVYHQNARASVVDGLSDFDLPDTAFATPVRAHTTTPLQALTLLNHRFTLDMAEALAARLAGEPEAQVRQAYALAFQRAPSVTERTAAADLIAVHGLRAFCRALLNASELIYVE